MKFRNFALSVILTALCGCASIEFDEGGGARVRFANCGVKAHTSSHKVALVCRWKVHGLGT